MRGMQPFTQQVRGATHRAYVLDHQVDFGCIEVRYDALEPGGYLFLGHSESISKMPVKFQAIVLGDCILYRKPTAEEMQKPELITEGHA